MIAVPYQMKRKIKYIFHKVISNTKILYIILFNEVAQDQDVVKFTGGLENVEYCTPTTLLKKFTQYFIFQFGICNIFKQLFNNFQFYWI